MSQAIWILQYDLKSGSEHEYLNWFHNIHIPEELARPGYLWAVHYKGLIGALVNSQNRRSYIALFGGVPTRTFLDPSPAELRDVQNDFIREMTRKRLSSIEDVFALEWSVNGSKTYKLISVTGGHFHGILYDTGFHHRIGPNKKVFKSQASDFCLRFSSRTL